MSWQAWLVLGAIALAVGLMALRRMAPDAALTGALVLVVLGGAVPAREAFAGIANEGLLTIAFLYVVVAGLEDTGAVHWLAHAMLGRPRGLRAAQLRLMLPTAALSAFMNNTPVVAVLIPAVSDWARRLGLPLSKLLLPLSYAAILGGVCTLIGSSTNLIVNGLLQALPGQQGLGMFEIAWVGLPCLLVGLAFLLAFAPRWLPEGRSALGLLEDPRRYTVEMLVDRDGPLVGRTIEEAGLRHLPELFLVEIEREGQVLPAIAPQERLRGGDRLVFAGVVDSVADLRRFRGLRPATDQIFKLDAPRPERVLVEAVVSDSSPLVGKSIREGRFRTRYNAAVIAVARNGERVQGKIGDIVLRPGDTLLLEAPPAFVDQQRNSRDFLLVSRVEGASLPQHERAPVALGVMAVLVGAVGLGWLGLLEGAMLAALLMVLTGCTSARGARQRVDWQVLITIAASLGLGRALEATGGAQALAQALLGLDGLHPAAFLGGLFLLTALLTALVSNSAAAVLMFPVAAAAARGLGLDLVPVAAVLMVAASASFATPIGYQTNLMVYGPGGYRFADYLRLGLPLTALVGLTAVAAAAWRWL